MVKRMLLVDDLEFDVQLTKNALQECAVEHEVVVAEDGVEALVQLRTSKFDLILLDLKMPRVDGFDVLTLLRATPSLSSIPVIVLSGSNLEADRVRAQILGVLEFVHKATDYTEFKDQLQRALSRHGMC